MRRLDETEAHELDSKALSADDVLGLCLIYLYSETDVQK